ncbi:hypothetical protein QFC21_002339 [Naganishia friedmannii]|uniref:Uncharacterized protein n=1 Tax=Naganishia friedmannii TaxID=89922 RepID=A0ACC2VZQ4_9TREE|nr:hypothetical protein QFC21_002339 [Naganishia friedmannii]
MDREVVGKCVEYLNTFKTADIFSSYHKRGEIKNQYDHMNLTDFEISQLLNLRPKNLDEARVLITSFERFEAAYELEELQAIIDIVLRPSAA